MLEGQRNFLLELLLFCFYVNISLGIPTSPKVVLWLCLMWCQKGSAWRGTDIILMGIEMVLCPIAGEHLKHGLESKVLGPSIFFLSFFWPHCMACGILVPWPGIKPGPPAGSNLGPPQWECWVLTSSPPENSPQHFLNNGQILEFTPHSVWTSAIFWCSWLVHLHAFTLCLLYVE